VYLRINAVIRNDRNETSRRQCAPDEPIIRLAAAVPNTTVEKHHHRRRLRGWRIGQINVEPLPLQRPVRNVSLLADLLFRRKCVEVHKRRTTAKQAGDQRNQHKSER